MASNGFSDRAVLMMKPDPQIPDVDFKRDAVAGVAGLGEVVAVFENEPANLNVLLAGFPRARGVFLDTIHSTRPDQPSEAAAQVADFRLPE